MVCGWPREAVLSASGPITDPGSSRKTDKKHKSAAGWVRWYVAYPHLPAQKPRVSHAQTMSPSQPGQTLRPP